MLPLFSQMSDSPIQLSQVHTEAAANVNDNVSISVTGKIWSAQNGKLLNSTKHDWLIELWFYVPLHTKQVISEMFPQANLLAWYQKN